MLLALYSVSGEYSASTCLLSAHWVPSQEDMFYSDWWGYTGTRHRPIMSLHYRFINTTTDATWHLLIH